MLSLGDFRAPTFSLSVTRDDVGLEGEFELFMQLLGTICVGEILVLTFAAQALSGIRYRDRRLYRVALRRIAAAIVAIILNVEPTRRAARAATRSL